MDNVRHFLIDRLPTGDKRRRINAWTQRRLDVYHAPDDSNESGPIELIVDPIIALSYLKNSHIRLLKLDFDLDFISDVLNAMESARCSLDTWTIGTVLISISSDIRGLSDEFLARVDDIMRPAHYRVQVLRYDENVENIGVLFSLNLLRQRGFRLQLQWPSRYPDGALCRSVRDAWTDFVLRSGAPYISVVYSDDMRETDERPFSVHQIIERLLEDESDELMAGEVELVALRPGLLSFRQESGELIAEEVDEGHVVFPPVTCDSRPLLLRMFRLYGPAKTLTLVTGMDEGALMALRLVRGHCSIQEIRANALKGDRASHFFVNKPY